MDSATRRALSGRLSSAEGLIPDPDGRRITWPSWAESLLTDDDPIVRTCAALAVHRSLDRDGRPLPA